MLLSYGNGMISIPNPKFRAPPHAKATILSRSQVKCCINESMQCSEESIARIKEMFGKAALLSVSAYDTAWVAMVPSRGDPNKPSFPQCLEWIMENQHQDGSWGLYPRHESLVKDYISCTLACVVALLKWRAGEQLVQRGLDFIRSNSWAVTDKEQCSPIGFDVIFTRMIQKATELGFNIPLDPVSLDRMLGNRSQIIDSFKGKEGILAYVAEGLRGSHFWEEVNNQQRSNGSFLNSPATTSAALIHHHDDKCFEYLSSLLRSYKSGVPTEYPSAIHARLYMVDAVERLGVDRFFTHEIESILNEAYRNWQLKSQDIFWDITCSAKAFRLLRTKGYELSSDEFERFTEQQFFDTTSAQFMSLNTVLELYRASQFIVHQNESILEKLHAWTSTYLKKQLDTKAVEKRLYKEVELAVTNLNGTLERIETRLILDSWNENNFQILKTSYRWPNISDRELLRFSMIDFNNCQAVHLAELQQLERWYKESRLDHLKDTRKVLHQAYFLISANLFKPEQSQARTSFARHMILITLVDDLFDSCGSKEELHNIVDLVRKWTECSQSDYISEQVEIFFAALYNTINEFASKALTMQGQCIKSHLISLWLEMLECMMKELDWWADKLTPTMDEYLSVASVTAGCNVCILHALYFLEPNFSVDIISSEGCSSLCKQAGVISRLLNDLQTYKKERDERKPNSISIQIVQSHGAVTEEEARKNIEDMLENSRRQMLRIVLQAREGTVQKVCKDLCWTCCRIAYFLYSFRDEFSSPKEMINHMNAVMYEPVNFPGDI